MPRTRIRRAAATYLSALGFGASLLATAAFVESGAVGSAQITSILASCFGSVVFNLIFGRHDQ